MEFSNKLLMRRDSLHIHLADLEKKKKELKKPRLWKVIDQMKVKRFLTMKFEDIDNYNAAITLE